MYFLTTSQIIVVGSIRTALPSSPLVGRKYLMCQNLGSVPVYVGGSFIAANTASDGGYQLMPYGTWRENYTNNIYVYGVTESNNCEVLVQEGK